MGGGVGGQGGIGGQGGTGWQGEHTQGRRSGWALMRFMAHSPLEYPPRGGIQYSDTRHSPFQSIWQSGCRAVFSASYPMSSPRPPCPASRAPRLPNGRRGVPSYCVYDYRLLKNAGDRTVRYSSVPGVFQMEQAGLQPAVMSGPPQTSSQKFQRLFAAPESVLHFFDIKPSVHKNSGF